MIFRIFLQGDRLRSVLVLLSLLAAAAVEAIGIGALLPAAGALLGEAGASTQSNQIAQGMIDWLGITPDFKTLVLLIAGAIVLKAVISFAALSYAAVVSADIAIGFRERLINSLFGASWRFYADQQAGKFAAAIANDATRASQAYLLAAQVLAQIAQAVLLGTVALLYNWQLAMASIAVGVFVGATMNRLIKISRAAGRREADTTANLTVKIVDLLANMKALKAMHRFQPMLIPIRRTLMKLRRALITGEVAKLGFNLGNEVVVTLLITVAAYLAYTSWNVTLPEIVVIGVIFLKINDIISKVQKAVQVWPLQGSPFSQLRPMQRNHYQWVPARWPTGLFRGSRPGEVPPQPPMGRPR
jgi:ATP-binding cassette subfamily C protein